MPSCADDWLLGTVLRGAWGFDGYVTGDCGAVADVFFSHNYTSTPAETVRRPRTARGIEGQGGGAEGVGWLLLRVESPSPILPPCRCATCSGRAPTSTAAAS